MVKTLAATFAVAMVASFGAAMPDKPVKPGCAGPRHLQIDDVSQAEGDSPARAFTEFTFQVTSTGCGLPMFVPFEISPIDDSDPTDVNARYGWIELAAGDLSPRTITAEVRPDNKPEHDDVFVVWISQPVGAGGVIDKCVGLGTILNDDRGVVIGPKPVARLHCSE